MAAGVAKEKREILKSQLPSKYTTVYNHHRADLWDREKRNSQKSARCYIYVYLNYRSDFWESLFFQFANDGGGGDSEKRNSPKWARCYNVLLHTMTIKLTCGQEKREILKSLFDATCTLYFYYRSDFWEPVFFQFC